MDNFSTMVLTKGISTRNLLKGSNVSYYCYFLNFFRERKVTDPINMPIKAGQEHQSGVKYLLTPKTILPLLLRKHLAADCLSLLNPGG